MQGRAVAGVADQDRPDLAVRVGDAEDRQAVVGRPLGIHAEIDPSAVLQHPPVGREADLPLGPRHPARLAGGQGLECDLLQGIGQRARVAIDPGLLIGRERASEDEAEAAAEGGAAVRVRRADDEPLARQAHPGLQPGRDLIGHMGRHAEVVDGQQDGRPFRVAADGQRLGLEPGLDAFRLGLPVAVSGQPDRRLGRDVDDRHPDGDGRLFGACRGRGRNQCGQAEAEEGGVSHGSSRVPRAGA